MKYHFEVYDDYVFMINDYLLMTIDEAKQYKIDNPDLRLFHVLWDCWF